MCLPAFLNPCREPPQEVDPINAVWLASLGQDVAPPVASGEAADGKRSCFADALSLKLPRFRRVFDGFVDYGSVVTASVVASYVIGER